jgi:hypothetical protein
MSDCKEEAPYGVDGCFFEFPAWRWGTFGGRAASSNDYHKPMKLRRSPGAWSGAGFSLVSVCYVPPVTGSPKGTGEAPCCPPTGASSCDA